MREYLPEYVADFLRDRYLAGVADAEALFLESSGDEDAVTGALGHALAMRTPKRFLDQSSEYSVKVSYRKLRGRGRGAPEKLYGADGVFQIQIADHAGRVVRQKALPFQSKIRWVGRNKGLFEQARTMRTHFPSGIVIDYSQIGYKACRIDAVIAARANRKQLNATSEIRSLGQILAYDFVDCTVGVDGLFFDPEAEVFELQLAAERPVHLITTSVYADKDVQPNITMESDA